MAKSHDIAVERVKAQMEKMGQGPCVGGQKLGSRKPDLRCRVPYIEVKTQRDLSTDHTKAQVSEMIKEAGRTKAPLLMYVKETECDFGANGLGRDFIVEKKLPDCG
jgi:hypothetical protein